MKVFVTTGDWRIEELTEQEAINAPTQTKKNDKTVPGFFRQSIGTGFQAFITSRFLYMDIGKGE